MTICRANVANLIFVACTILFLGAAAYSQVALAQTPAPQPDPMAEAIGVLASDLDKEQQSALIGLLTALKADPTTAAASETRPSAWQVVKESFVTFGERLWYHVKRFPTVISGTFQTIAGIFATRGVSGSAVLLALLCLVLAIGVAATYCVIWLSRTWRQNFQTLRSEYFAQQIRALLIRFGLELSGLLAFTIAAVVSAYLFVSHPPDRTLIVSFLLTAVFITWFTAAFLRFILAPNRPDLRLVAANDATSKSIFVGYVGLGAVIGAGFFLFGVMTRSEVQFVDSFRFWVALLVICWIIGVMWRTRAGLTSIIKGEDENLTSGLEIMAAWWPGVSMFIVGLTWLFIQFVLSTGTIAISPAQGATAIALVVATPFLDTAVRGIVKHLVPPIEGEGSIAEAAYLETRNSYVRIGRVLMLTILVLIILRTLGISFRGLAEAGFGAQIASNSVQCLLVIACGYIAWEVVNLWVNGRLAQETAGTTDGSPAGDAEPGGAGQSRIASVLPLIHITLQIAIVILTALLALSQLGFNITPLLAGAGVLGLAIGFGAQTLVKDIVSGVFFLLDDAFRLGEYIDVGGTMGSVEKISVRSLQLRGAKGPVHIVPYGAISKLTNHSRDWVIMKIRFTVPFDTDVEKVRKLFKKIGQEMMEVPELAEGMLAPFKSQGVADVDDVGIVVRGKFTAKPGTQFEIRKEIYTRVQKAFEENGIQFARKEVRVQFPGDDKPEDLTSKQKSVAAGAALAAAEPKPTGA